jgi:hypothetical protein
MLIEEQMAPTISNALIRYVCHACFIFWVHLLSLKSNSDIVRSDIDDLDKIEFGRELNKIHFPINIYTSL